MPVRFRCLGLLAFTRFSIPFRIFILKILHSINLVHIGTGGCARGVPAQNPLITNFPAKVFL